MERRTGGCLVEGLKGVGLLSLGKENAKRVFFFFFFFFFF